MLETVEDAIKDDVAVLGGPKEAARHFFPDKSPDQGAAILRAWALENRSERPSPSQFLMLIELARTSDAGVSECARFFEQRLVCRIEWLSPEDEQRRHEREFIEAVTRLEQIQERIVRNQQREPSLKTVRK